MARRVAGCVVAVLAVAALVGCEPAGTAGGAARAGTTLVVGDSVTVVSADRIRSAVPGAHVAATPGARTDHALPLVREWTKAGTPRLVLLLGHADLYAGTDGAKVEALAEAASGFDCAVWLLVPTEVDDSSRPRPYYSRSAARAWNTRVAKAAAARGVHVEPRWRDVVDSVPPHTYTSDDGLHPNAAGQWLLARIVAESLKRCSGTRALPPVTGPAPAPRRPVAVEVGNRSRLHRLRTALPVPVALPAAAETIPARSPS